MSDYDNEINPGYPEEAKPKFKIGDRVWFLKSMRMCKVVHVMKDGYIVEIMDSGKKLFAIESGLKYL